MHFKPDYLNQSIEVSGLPTIKYASLFHYLPYKLPAPLRCSDINIDDFCQKTTLHHRFPNISMINNLGRTAPTTVSVDRLITTSAYNIFFQLMKTNEYRLAETDQYTEYDVWLNQDQVFRVAYDGDNYKGTKLIKDLNNIERLQLR